MTKLQKLKYIAEKNYHSLDEITKLLIEIVEDLDKEQDNIKIKVAKIGIKPKLKEEPITIKPKKKRKWL